MSVRDGYKMTELCELPAEWDCCKIGDIANVTKLAGFEFTEYINYVEDGEIIAIRALNLKKGKLDLNETKRITREVSEKLERSRLYINDILFSYVGTIGETAIVEEDNKYHLAPNVAKITPFNDVSSQFLHQYLRSETAKKGINEHLTTTSQPALSMGNLRDISVPVPPLPEQKKIADILSTVDEHISETESLIEKTKVLKQGMMQQLLTKGIGHTEFKETEIGRIPVEWEVKRICEIGELKKSSVDKLCIDGETPRSLINYMDVYRNNKLYRENVSMLISATEKEINEYSISSGDVLITPTSETPEDIGRFSVVYDELPNTLYSYHLTRLRVKMPMYIDYKAYFLSPEYVRNQFRIRAQGSTRFVISNSAIGECIVPLPPYSEQKQIASILSSIDDQISFSEIKLTALTKLKSALMQQLLTGKTRVKV